MVTEATSIEAPPEEASPPAEVHRCYPKFRGNPLYGGNGEALGWALDSVGRSVAFICAGAFLGTALLRLAKLDAGCEVDPPEGETKVPDCDGRVYGIRPSSLLTTYTIIIGVLSTALMPLMGAIVDYTPHRRRVARTTSVVFCVLLIPQIFVSQETWFAIAIIHIASAFIGWAQSMITYAYLPELTEDKQLLNKFTSNFTVVQFMSMVVYLVAILAVAAAAGIGDDEVAVARLGQTVAVVVCSIMLFFAWGPLIQPRPALHELPEGRSIWTAGFFQIYHTSIRIYRHFPALKWFYVAVAFSDAAIQSLATIAITYLTDQLEFTSTENGLAILIMLIASIPGGVAAGAYTARFENAVHSSIISTAILIITTTLFAIFVTGPGQQALTYTLAGGWGLGTGWKWTSDKLLSSTIIPRGQDAELMGMFLFAGQVLTWIPPLVFTALNEAGVSQRIGIASLNVFCLIGMGAYFLMGSYNDAIKWAARAEEVQNTTDIDNDEVNVISESDGNSDALDGNSDALEP